MRNTAKFAATALFSTALFAGDCPARCCLFCRRNADRDGEASRNRRQEKSAAPLATYRKVEGKFRAASVQA